MLQGLMLAYSVQWYLDCFLVAYRMRWLAQAGAGLLSVTAAAAAAAAVAVFCC